MSSRRHSSVVAALAACLVTALVAAPPASAADPAKPKKGSQPKIKSFSPTSGPIGTTVTISGTNLSGAPAVTFNGTAAQSVIVDSATQITAVVAAGSTTGKIAVATSGGTATSKGKFTVTVPAVPKIGSFSPTTSAAFAPVTITGSGFTGATDVSFDGTRALDYTVVSDTQIKAWLAPGTTSGKVSVTTPVGTGTSSSPLTVAFLIEFGACQRQPDTVFGVLPGTPIWFGTGWAMKDSSFLAQFLSNTKTTLTVNGKAVKKADAFWDRTGLPGASSTWVTRFDYDPKVTISSVGSTLTASFQVVAKKTLQDGFDTYPAGTNLWPANPCRIVGMPLATFSSFSPASGPVGMPVTITGQDLGWVNGISFGGAPAVVTHVDNTTLRTRVPAGAETGPITLSQGPQAKIPSPSDFSFTPSALAVDSVSPDSGVVGTSVTLHGSGFYRVTSVRFGGTDTDVPAPTSDTTLTVAVPTGAHTGPVSISDGSDTAQSATFSVLEPAGNLDETFGSAGIVAIDADPTRAEQVTAVRVDAEGRIVAAGRLTPVPDNSPSTGPLLVRLNPDGSLDQTFGIHGVVIADLAAAPFFKARALEILDDGKILVGGTIGYGGPEGGDRFAVMRFLPDGSVDPTFGAGGVAAAYFWKYTVGNHCGIGPPGMGVAADGSIALAGPACSGMGIVKFRPDGALDESYGTAGLQSLDLPIIDNGPYAVSVAPDGKVVLGSTTDGPITGYVPAFFAARFNADGSPDTSFGTEGIAQIGNPAVRAPHAAALDTNGNTVFAGEAAPYGFAVARFTPGGQPDATFGAGGSTTTEETVKPAYGVSIQADGRILAVGGRFVARYTSGGGLDSTFGNGGTVAAPVDTFWVASALQPDGNLVVAGTVGSDAFSIARYTTASPVVP